MSTDVYCDSGNIYIIVFHRSSGSVIFGPVNRSLRDRLEKLKKWKEPVEFREISHAKEYFKIWISRYLKRICEFNHVILQIETTFFEEFFNFTKWKNTFLRRFSSLQNEKASFWSVFHLHKMKKHVFEAFSSLQNEKARFRSDFHLYKMKKQVFKAFFIFTKWKHIFESLFISTKWKIHVFWSVFNLYKMKKQVFEAFFIFTNRKNKFSKRFFIFIKWKHVFQAFLGL